MKIYISLPISGHTGDDVEQRIGMAQVALEKYVKSLDPADQYADPEAEKFVTRLKKEFDGRNVFNPVDLNDSVLSDHADENNYEAQDAVTFLCEDIKSIICNVDVVLLCDGFEDSRGCMIEATVALMFGKKLLFLRNGKVYSMNSYAIKSRFFDRSNALTQSCFDQIEFGEGLPF